MLRRDFCKWSLLALVPVSLYGCHNQRDSGSPFKAVFSGCDDLRGNHYIAQLDGAGEFAARIAVPQRVHGSVFLPQQQRALFFARRPGTHLYSLDTNSGELVFTLSNSKDRHFYGHGVVSNDGNWLYATENNLNDLSGIIGVYALSNNLSNNSDRIKKVAEFSSGGIGPHQLAMMPDQSTLVVANGGMATHPNTGRKVLNLDTMEPNLTYLRVSDGKVLESHKPPHHKMSIRHLDVANNGRVVFGVQHQGDLTDAVPLVGSHHRGEDIAWLEMPEALQLKVKQYTASVAVDETGALALVSCPRGNLIGCWELNNGRFQQQLNSHDAAGLFRAKSGTWVSSTGYGQVSLLTQSSAAVKLQPLSTSSYRWDNHLTVI